MTDKIVLDQFDKALANEEFCVFYQPQINHSTKRMMGAEALVRWQHPNEGMIPPIKFISVLEDNDLIYKLDLYVFEQVCKLQKELLDAGIIIVPISFNVSRHDIKHPDFISCLEEIRVKYNLPVKYLRVEITESSAIGGIELLQSILDQLHYFGYKVEMDDFGSGYSSLNVLKDIPVDVLKLDMRFMGGLIGGRGGTIVKSIINMANWLNTPVIAEGVETEETADYLKSIGCNYIQGYVYSKPVPRDVYIEKVKTSDHELERPALELINAIDAGKFWDPVSMDTLIFSNLVGGAAILAYEEGKAEILRINEKYLTEIGMNQAARDVIINDPWKQFDDENRRIYENAILKAIETGEEVECGTWRIVISDCCGQDDIYVESTIRMIGKAGKQSLLYIYVKNKTAEQKLLQDRKIDDSRFVYAFEHANVYAWEYTIATKEMRPCFRCMRDLGLPALVKNYPESAFEAMIFPPEVADKYREFMKKIDEGIGEIEDIFPLTVGRVPFHVRYTTEYDESGRPLKAYGSATLVVDK